jgi:uncharacterized protein
MIDLSPVLPAIEQKQERIQLIDAIRGVTVLGILLMNITLFSNSHAIFDNLEVLQEYDSKNYYTWWIIEGFLEGTMRAIFSMLFGVSCVLLVDNLKDRNISDPAELLLRRMMWLLVFGFFNAFILLWPGDILYMYGVCGLFLYPLLKARRKYLLLICITALLLSTIIDTANWRRLNQIRVKGEHSLALESRGVGLSERQKGDKEKWLEKRESINLKTIRQEAETDIKTLRSADYRAVFNYMAPINIESQTSYFYHFGFLQTIFMIVLGIILYRNGFIVGKAETKWYLLTMLVAYGIGLPLSYLEHATKVDVKFDSTLLYPRLLINFYEVRRLLLALGNLSVIILFFKLQPFTVIFNTLAKVGKLSFTNYLMQSILCALTFYGFGFGMFGQLQRYETYYIVAAIWAFQILFSIVWLRFFRIGPFEWGWRSLTYWKIQMLRN